MLKKIFFGFLFLAVAGNIFAQNFDANPAAQVHEKDISQLSPMEIMEDSLVFFADSMLYSPIDENRIEGSYAFIRILKNALKTEGSAEYPFEKLEKKIFIIRAPDNTFRIFNWEIVRSNQELRYYGALQFANGTFQPLIDVSNQIIRGEQDSILFDMKWYGGLYYNIIQKEINGNPLYFLFGWNGNSLNGNKKFIEVMGYSQEGKPIFGGPVFHIIENNRQKRVNRFILEYKADARVSLNYDKDKDMIIFDHCESQIGDIHKKYTYVPDGTYDGLKWNGSSWEMHRNVIEIQDLKAGNTPGEN